MNIRVINGLLAEAKVFDGFLSDIQDEAMKRRDLLATVAEKDPEAERLFNRWQEVFTRLVEGRKEFGKLMDLLVEVVRLVETGT